MTSASDFILCLYSRDKSTSFSVIAINSTVWGGSTSALVSDFATADLVVLDAPDAGLSVLSLVLQKWGFLRSRFLSQDVVHQGILRFRLLLHVIWLQFYCDQGHTDILLPRYLVIFFGPCQFLKASSRENYW